MVAAVIAFVSALPVAGAMWQLTPILLIPAIVFVWAWRAGTDVYTDELRVKALFGSTRVPWNRITELAPDTQGRVSALLDNGNVIRLTAIDRQNLPRVLAVSQQEIHRPD
jgi:hypothetical protein